MLLLLVALLYGTLNVSLRLVYNMPNPPSASVLSASRGWMAALCFLPPLLFSSNTSQYSKVNTSSRSLFTAGFELAFWNFGSQAFLNLGLLTISSARASFLTQTSVVLTPLISVLSGQPVPLSVWGACLLALCGLGILSGSGGSAAGGLLTFSGGDWLVLAGSLCWSFYLFRMSKLAIKFIGREFSLQAAKTGIMAVFYSIWLGLSMGVASASGGGIASIVGGWIQSPIAWILLFYSALGPGAIADVAQQQGQKEVSATEANILLSMEPLFTGICAFLLLRETMLLKEVVGGSLILAAALLSSS